ncbi:MAG: hypothetical protein EOM40_05550 [Clostridia bacterium]|nr:hypothetical protein [Clostridia bacterium]NCC44567.1 hypothetical protein [Clostridia bacterium]
MSKILEFKGTWRTYQKRVLLHSDEYLKDGKIHIVAAPGSGKTTLGIELIGRIDQPALILAPSITIREQWIERIKDAFLKDGIKGEDYLSNNLKNPRFITVATYQALHSAMTRYRGEIADEPEETTEEFDDTALIQEKEEVDYSNFELVDTMKRAGLGTICLDECHHLRSEWWKALENFRKSFAEAKVISLTATPPYDSLPAMWKRYIDMCGEIDEEITIPELVKEGSLCPHQDYVLLNYPTREEMKEIGKFKESSENMMRKLLADESLTQIVKSHKGLYGETSDEVLLDDPAYLSSILIYLQEKKIEFPKRLLRLLGAKRLPAMEAKWMERLMQGILYDDTESYLCDKVYREQLISELKVAGLLEKKKVCMAASAAIEKLLTRSKGKIESIKEITFHEYASMGSSLRLLILTDYIRKECEKNLGDSSVEMNQMGVLPFFELLRREAEDGKHISAGGKLRLGVLCGTMIIIPAEAKPYLIEMVGVEKVTFSQAGVLSSEDYLEVKAVGNTHFLTAAVTELFNKGYIQALIGTKSLLGEGWDAPCVNSLVLASFVGSFMLSNQMRGRAIRIDKENPDKTSNVWHLVCVNPVRAGNENESGANSEDFQMLSRRMEHFLGLHYEENTIENGMRRLSVIQPPFTKSNVEKINKQMLAMSDKREQLKTRWEGSLAIFDQIEVTEEVDISERLITVTAFYDALRAMAKIAGLVCIEGLIRLGFRLHDLGVVGLMINMALAAGIIFFGIKAMVLSSPLKRLKIFGAGIRKAMLEKGMISSENCKVETQSALGIFHAVYLMGGTGKEKADFANCVLQFFSEIDNQRYLLVNRKKRNRLDGFFAVPDAFAKKKEDAQVFAECMRPFIGKYELVYTRNEEGRKLLLEGRVKALGNREERCASKKKAKGALE